MNMEPGAERATPLTRIIDAALQRAGGWLPFDRFMALALYAPGLGYYANASRKFGQMPDSGSDFVTAPELTPLFGRTLARAAGRGAGARPAPTRSGSSAPARARWPLQLLDALGERVARYRIVDLSGTLRERQQQALARHGRQGRVAVRAARRRCAAWWSATRCSMRCRCSCWRAAAAQWFERGVVRAGRGLRAGKTARPTLRPPVEIAGAHDYLTEIHPQARAFIATLAERLQQGAAFFIDYGFPEAEYYHPQRHMGTVMCHRGHLADADPLADVGAKDITAHVDFTGIALAGQDAGLEVLGYTSQARFLLNAGILPMMEPASLAERTLAARLIHEHEMGELFKVIGFAVGAGWDASGFAEGDRSHTL